MPPHGRVVERVARFQFGDLRGSECLAQSREAPEVRRVDVRHGHDLTAWRRLERTWIEILDLLGRKQREAAPTDQATGDVVRQVVVGERRGAVADPRADQRWIRFEHCMVQDEVVLGAEAGQIRVHVRRPDVDGRRTVVVEMREDTVEILVQQTAIGLEIETGGVGCIAETALQFRPGDECDDTAAPIEGLDVVRRLSCGGDTHKRPVTHQSPDDDRLLRSDEFVVRDRVRCNLVDCPRLLSRLDHRAHFSACFG